MALSSEAKVLSIIGIATLLIVVGGVFIANRKPPSGPQSVQEDAFLTNARHTIGSPTAPVKIIEFADLQCPACAAANPIIKKVLANNQDKVYFVYYHFPLPAHQYAIPAAKAAEAAGAQNKFWEMVDLIFTNQNSWSQTPNPKDVFINYAQDLGLNLDQFKADWDKFGNVIDDHKSLGLRSGVDSTPTFFINGQKYPGVQSETTLQNLIDQLTGS